MKSGLHCLRATDQQSSSGTPSFSGQLHTLSFPRNATEQHSSWSFCLGPEGAGEDVWSSGQARLGPAGCHLFPVLPRAWLKAARQSGQRKLRAWGAEPSPTSLLGSGTERPLPGYGASLLHQQIVSIPSLQELPRAPRKRDAETEPRPRLFQSLEGPHSSSDPEL